MLASTHDIRPATRTFLVCLALAASLHAQSTPRLTDAQVDARANALIAQMTPEEKAGQLIKINGLAAGGAQLEQAIKAGRLGSVAYITDPHDIDRLQHVAVEQSRLKIPLLFAMDMVHGQRTIFPVPLALAATWDPKLVEQVESVEALESHAVGLSWTFAPMLDIARDPRWGRIVEGAGEDPYLGSAMARAEVRGLQGNFLGAEGHILAGPKHFAAYGATIGGRDYAEVNVSDSDLWNIYFPPFESAIRAGAGNVMTAYMPLNGVPAAANTWLLQDVLRGQWGFKGFTVSDANNINALVTMGLAQDPTDAAARALKAGEDMESGFFTPAYENLPQALTEGKITEAQLDSAVRRILEAKIRLGLFEHPYVDQTRVEAVLSDPAHRDLARLAAASSAVLLRNQGALLPLRPSSLHSIAVIGPLADSKRDTLGPWVKDQHLDETVTVLEGLRAQAGPSLRIDYAPGVAMPTRTFPSFFDAFLGVPHAPTAPFDAKAEMSRAVALASHSDVAVLVLGEPQNMDGEAASRSSLDLPGDQQALLEAVAATGKPIVLLLMTARPLELRWASTHIPAILDIWYPGTKGGDAVADLLFGKASPRGKLPITWVRDVGQVPFPYDLRQSHQPATNDKRYENEESTPLYPFGYGLSYAAFTFDNLRVDRASIKTGESATVSVDVHNTGSLDAVEVVQLYLHQRFGSTTRPVRELKGFQSVMIPAGASRSVTFTLGPAELRYWSTATRSIVQEASTFDLWTGADSAATLHTTFAVTP
jgi:beta-glucosidase